MTPRYSSRWHSGSASTLIPDSPQAACTAALAEPASVASPVVAAAQRSNGDERFVTEARFYHKLSNGRVHCTLCPRECNPGDGVRGYCGVRENRGGVLYTLVHSRVCSAHIDPIEKKPLFHYLPGTGAFSVATAGCNVNCKFCQNWELSQAAPEDAPAEFMPPEKVLNLALQYQCPTIAFTYTEPIIAGEFVIDTAELAHRNGIRTIAISNGYIHKDALGAVYGRMDAVKIDLKAFSESYYRKIVAGELKPVLETLVALAKLGKWTEIVYLLVPALNDRDEELTALARWIKENLGADVPLHFSQFHPDYKMLDVAVTPVPSLERAKQISDAEGLHFVYIGNVPGHPAQNTCCPQCGSMLVERTGFEIRKMLIRDGACPFCAHAIPGIWCATT